MGGKLVLPVLASILILVGFGLTDAFAVDEVDLHVFKTVNDVVPVQGDIITYTIAIVNTGPFPATNVVIDDDLEDFAEVNIINEPPVFISVGTWDPITGIWSIPSLPVGVENQDEVFLQFRAQVELNTAGTIVKNTATATADEPDTDLNDNVDQATILVKSADLEILKTFDVSPVNAGQTTTITLKVINNGPFDAEDVEVIDVLPSGLSVSALPAECTESPTGTVTCDLGDIANGAMVFTTFTVLVDAAFTGSSIDNTGTVTTTTGDPTPGNDSSTDTLIIGKEADVEILKTFSPSPVNAGDTTTITLKVTNNGPSDSDNVMVVDVLQSGLSVSALPAECTESPVGTVTCTFGTIANGAMASTTFTVLVNAAFTGTSIDNTGTLSSTTPDPDAGNDSDQATIIVTPTPSVDLHLFKIVNDAFPLEGDIITYTIAIVNTGPSPATNVVIDDNLEDFPEVNILNEPPVLIDVGTWDPINGIWSIPSLPVGVENQDEVFLQFRAQVELNTAGTIVKNTVTATADEPDTDLNDNVDQATILVNADSDGDGIPDSVDPDDDNDGIHDDLDSLPTVFSQFFSDGVSSGTITSGQQFLTISDVPGPGINIVATGSATVDACGISSITFTAGEAQIICASITIEMLSGSADIVYTAEDGTTTTSTLNAGDNVTYEDTQSGEITNNGSEEISISINGGDPIPVGIGETITIEPTLTLQEQIDALKAQVNDSADKKDAKKLTNKLDKVTKELGKDKLDKACKEMGKFIKDVKKLEKKGKITNGTLLKSTAEDIKAVIGCS